MAPNALKRIDTLALSFIALSMFMFSAHAMDKEPSKVTKKVDCGELVALSNREFDARYISKRVPCPTVRAAEFLMLYN